MGHIDSRSKLVMGYVDNRGHILDFYLKFSAVIILLILRTYLQSLRETEA
jgi:hypothetical protein